MLKTVKMISFLACSFLSSHAIADSVQTPDLTMVPEGCVAVFKVDGWGVACPSVIDENRADYMRNKPNLIMPGYPSHGSGYTPSTTESNTRPGGCELHQREFVKTASQFIGWLDRQKNNSSSETLTRQAAYSVEQHVRQYQASTTETALGKARYAMRGSYDGDIACVRTFKHGKSELIRVTQIVLNELNNGNRDLANTGLNQFPSPYN